MKAMFRVDASVTMGTGHLMRSLALADVLRKRGWKCLFATAMLPRHLAERVVGAGHDLFPLHGSLDAVAVASSADARLDLSADASALSKLIDSLDVDLLVVDHYGLDREWELAVSGPDRALLVIDDLANRHHRCSLLLDQTLGRSARDYRRLVPPECLMLLGPSFAMVRSEFANLRATSLARRNSPSPRKLLISLGGTDPANVSGKVLRALAPLASERQLETTVVLGAASPWLDGIRDLLERLALPVEICVEPSDLAQRMADCDLAIGAPGASSWERCSLGLPAILVKVASNQSQMAEQLRMRGAAIVLDSPSEIDSSLASEVLRLLQHPEELSRMSAAAAAICDGSGTEAVADEVEKAVAGL